MSNGAVVGFCLFVCFSFSAPAKELTKALTSVINVETTQGQTK
jgi:hypothetical protein